MTVGHPRKQLAGILSDALPKTWNVFDNERNFDSTTKRTVLVRQRTIGRLPQAPIKTRIVGFVVTLCSPHRDLVKAEDDLDSAIPILLDVFDGLHGLSWSEGTKVMVPSSSNVDVLYLGYDFPINTNTKKENL